MARLTVLARALLEAIDADVGIARLSDDELEWVCPKCAQVECLPECTRGRLLAAADELEAAIRSFPAASPERKTTT